MEAAQFTNVRSVIEKVKAIFNKKGYVFFENGDFNLNIVGIRSKENAANKFDDLMIVLYKEKTLWTLRTFKITTDPGLWELQSPSFHEAQIGGTAVLAEGQYRGAYRLSYHGTGAWRHKALVQVKPVSIYRDKNRDAIVDKNKQTITTGLYGINIHASSLNQEQSLVQNWSAGCQVFGVPSEYRQFISLCENAALKYGDVFTYTLLNESDFV